MKLLIAKRQTAAYPGMPGQVQVGRAVIPVGDNSTDQVVVEILDVLAAFEIEEPK